MLAGPGAPNTWVISAEERAKHDSQFFTLKPVNGFVTGAQAKQFFMQSGLPVAILGQVWGLADINQDGKMDKREFSIAMHLIKKKLQGIELPKSLPPSLKQDPAPTMGSFGPSANPPGSIAGPTPVMGMRPATGLGGFAPGGPVPTAPGAQGFAPGQGFAPMNGASANHPSYLGGSATLPHSGLVTKVVQSPNLNMAPVVSVVEWAIPHTQKLKYNQLFNQHDRMRKGSIGGMEAKAILSSTGLTHGLLAQIWNLADIDADGQLTNDEFCVAMHLVDMAKSGQTLPQKLPPELIPPSFRRGRSGSTSVAASAPTAIPPPQPVASATLPRSFASNFAPGTNSMPAAPPPVQQQDSFGDLLGGFAAVPSSPAPAVPPAVPEPSEPEPAANVTFEDKRKENFDKGQAELERRRAQLQEELKKQEEERMAAERAEHEKRERVRLEQERKKQQELEKQLEKQRQMEQEREEQRRKVLEQREAARREMERQRQLEWERQRRDQLNSEKQREHQQVDRLHSEVGELKLELEALDNKKAELKAKIELAKQNVNEFTTTIDGMRQTRDRTLTEIDQYQKDAIDWNRKAARSQHEKKQLEGQVQGSSSQNDDAYKGISNNVSTKKSNTEKLKSEFSKIETETASVLKEIDSRNSKLMEVADALTAANAEVLRLREEYEMKQEEWNVKKKSGASFSGATSSSNAWGSDTPFSSYSSSAAPAQTSTSAVDAWGSSQTTTTTSASSNAWGDMFSADQVDGQSKLALSLPDVRRVSHTYARTTSSERELTTLWEDASLQQWADFPPLDRDLFKSSAKSSSQDTTWANSFFSDLKPAPKKAETSEPAPASAEPSSTGSKRHVAIYQFDARNSDELTLSVGEVVWVKADQTGAEPGWLNGECNGRSGWFPEAYVQPEDEGVSNGFEQQTEFASQDANNHNQDFGSTPSLLTTSEQSSFTAVPSSGPSPTPGEIAKEPLQACALYPWRAKKENHLTFDKGDIILVKEQQDMWWSGELHGMSGWFPKSYVKLIGSSVTASSALEQAQGEAPSVEEPTADTANTTSELYVAAYTYSSPEPGDLSFAAGESITVTKKTDDWWTGTIGDRSGIFPANYVTEYQGEIPAAQTEPAAEEHQQQLQPQVATEQQRSGTRRNSRLSSSSVNSLDSVPEWGLSQVTQKLSTTKKPEIATVIAPYQATGPEQLSLNPGQLIQVRKKSNSGWWEGELQARGQKRRVGWFPANYVKMLSSSARNTPDAAAQKSLSPTPQPGDGSRSGTPVSMPQPTSAPALEQVVALYNYDAQREDELTFTKGGVISVIDKDDPDWWKGEFNGLTGVFPSNYVSPMAEEQSCE